MRITSIIIVVTALIMLLGVNPSFALVKCDFEGGTDWQSVENDFEGFTFGWAGGGDVLYADIKDTLSLWPFKSANGKQNDDWAYLIDGDFAGFSMDDTGLISLLYGDATYLSMSYSSEYDIVLKAYTADGGFLAQSIGKRNCKSSGATEMAAIRVDAPGISYVTISALQGSHPVAGCWVIDSLESDAVIPEPSAIMTLCVGLLGLSAMRRKA